MADEEEWSRKRLRAEGFLPLIKSSDLHAYGYQIVHWFSARRVRLKQEPSLVFEYVPATVGQKMGHAAQAPTPSAGRLTATTLNGQIAAHRAIGAPVRYQGAFSFLFE